MGFDREEHIGPQGPKENSKNDYKLAAPEENGKLDPAGAPTVAPTYEAPSNEWYTVRGIERKNRAGDLRLILTMTTVGFLSYGIALTNVLSWKPAYLN